MTKHRHIYCSLGNTTDDLQADIDAAHRWIADMDAQTYATVLTLIDAEPVNEKWIAGLRAAGAPEPTSSRADYRGYIFAMEIAGRSVTPCWACEEAGT